jgi:hypothetical protein
VPLNLRPTNFLPNQDAERRQPITVHPDHLLSTRIKLYSILLIFDFPSSPWGLWPPTRSLFPSSIFLAVLFFFHVSFEPGACPWNTCVPSLHPLGSVQSPTLVKQGIDLKINTNITFLSIRAYFSGTPTLVFRQRPSLEPNSKKSHNPLSILMDFHLCLNAP